MMWKCVIVQTVIWVDQLPVNVEIPHIREATENVTKQQTGLEEIYFKSFYFIYSDDTQMNRKLLESWPLEYTIDILLRTWFHLMG